MNTQPIESQRELMCTRVMPGSADLFFEMWSSPEVISKWWVGPEMPIKTDYLDFRPKGEWIYTGNAHSHRIKFTEIQPDRIVLEGDWQAEVTLDRLDANHTRVAFRQFFPQPDDQERLERSVTRLENLLADAVSLDKPRRLVLTLPNDHEIRSVRSFDARRPALFSAFTDPRHLCTWQGPVTHRCLDCTYEPEVGGRWSLAYEDPEGNIWNLRGQILEVQPNERIVSTFTLGGSPGLEHVNTIHFQEIAHQTRVVIVSTFKSSGARDAMLELGKERCLAHAYHRLDALIEASRMAQVASKSHNGRAYPG